MRMTLMVQACASVRAVLHSVSSWAHARDKSTVSASPARVWSTHSHMQSLLCVSIPGPRDDAQQQDGAAPHRGAGLGARGLEDRGPSGAAAKHMPRQVVRSRACDNNCVNIERTRTHARTHACMHARTHVATHPRSDVSASWRRSCRRAETAQGCPT